MSEVRLPATLRMLADLVEEAKQTGAGSFNVYPVVVDNLRESLPLIEAALRYNRTSLAPLDTVDGIDIGEGGSPDPAMLGLVRAISWPDLPGGVTRQLEPSWPDGLLQVRFGEMAPPDNPGDRASLSLYTSLLDPGFDSQVGAIVYDETFMDADARAIAWSVLLDELPRIMASDQPPEFCRSLLIFVGVAELDWDRHCRAGGDGARYLVVNGEISRRYPWRVNNNAVTRLAALPGPMVFYLGAGASRSSGLPTGNELRDAALRRRFPAEQDADFQTLAKLFFTDVQATQRLLQREREMNEDQFVDSLSLERVLREEMKDYSGPGLSPTLADFKVAQDAQLDHPGATMQILRDMLRQRSRLVLLTVNFDQMIEHGATVLRGFNPSSEPSIDDAEPAVRLFVTDEELADFPAYFAHYREHGGVIPLLKLHGSIDLGPVIANVDETLPGLSGNAGAALQCLSDEQNPIAWVYIGCSMRDLDVQRLTNDASFAVGSNEHWVSPMVDRHVIEHVEENRSLAWQRAGRRDLGSRTITWSSDEFFQTLAPRFVFPAGAS